MASLVLTCTPHRLQADNQICAVVLLQLLASVRVVCFSRGSCLAATGKLSITKNIQHNSDVVHGCQLLPCPRL